MAAGRLRWLLLLALALAEPPFPRRPLVPPRENMMPWYTAGKPSRESSEPPTEHTYKHQEATGMRLLRQRAAELSSPPPPTRSNRGRSQGLDAGISAAAQVHGRYHVITMYNPRSPFTRLHVAIREECCEIGRVLFGCVSERSLPLLLPISSHLLPLRWRRRRSNDARQNVAQTCRWRFIIPRLRLAPPVPYTL